MHTHARTHTHSHPTPTPRHSVNVMQQFSIKLWLIMTNVESVDAAAKQSPQLGALCSPQVTDADSAGFTVLARRSALEFKFSEVTAVPSPERCRFIGKLLFARDAICSAATLRKSTGGIISTPCSPNPLSTPSNPHQCAHSLLPLRKTKTKNTSWIYMCTKPWKI